MRLLNDILMFRKVQSNTIELKVGLGDLNKFIRDIASEFSEYALNKEIEFIVEADEKELESVPFDRKVMEKIIMNLLDNAFKYTGMKGIIRLIACRGVASGRSIRTHTVLSHLIIRNCPVRIIILRCKAIPM